ncbi:hypothetical protein [Legionella worsleiensis]|uniref:Uncharacterized protein n=1 Tax=Legionella worsleiensis TaxID=45076 RepID=A0A0W1AFX7_9GAMM|nr:hypothetical protein [Legionella worsleiensis]KTD80236.1 hypothetical protein Lwor_1144 [Legionella worsleiensis]STY31673.1 Uncharacterised protein [Legionella worsleiensis]
MDELTTFSEKQNLLQYTRDHALFARTPGFLGSLFSPNSKGKIQELMKEIAPENTALISVNKN